MRQTKEFKSERHYRLDKDWPDSGAGYRVYDPVPKVRRTDPTWWQKMARAFLAWI